MKVTDIITGLLNSELSNTSLGSLDTTELNQKMLIWLNQAIRDINLRVPIIQKSMVYQLGINTIDNNMTYMLPSDFQGLLSVWDEVGKPVSINSSSDPLSVYTPEPFKLMVPYSSSGAIITIVYQAEPPIITDVDSTLPVSNHFEAIITYYIAAKALAGLETQGKPVNLSYESKYEKAMALLIASGMYNKEPVQNETCFSRGGWI